MLDLTEYLLLLSFQAMPCTRLLSHCVDQSAELFADVSAPRSQTISMNSNTFSVADDDHETNERLRRAYWVVLLLERYNYASLRRVRISYANESQANCGYNLVRQKVDFGAWMMRYLCPTAAQLGTLISTQALLEHQQHLLASSPP